MIYKPTGQKILFRGMDDPMKITSITVPVGFLCWCWVEEAFQIEREADFDTLDESIRGDVGEGLWKQITLSFNPWLDSTWIKKRFFDADPDPDVLTKVVDYRMNEFLDDADRRKFEKMKRDNPARYLVAGLANWGVAEGLIHKRFKIENFSIEDVKKIKGIESSFGLDFGFQVDPSSFHFYLFDNNKMVIYVCDELYKTGLTNRMLAENIIKMGYGNERITADSGEPKSIVELDEYGLSRVEGAKKGPDSVRNGIDFLQDYQFVIHPKCENFHAEIATYRWKTDRTGKQINEPEGKNNHAMDDLRYAAERFHGGSTFSFD